MSRKKVLPANSNITEVAHPNMLKSMKVAHIIGSWLGVLPVRDITSNSLQRLSFSWISLKTAYTLCYLLAGIYLFTKDVKRLFGSPERIHPFLAITYRMLCSCVIIGFLKLSRGMRKLMFLWCEMDRAMNKVYGYPESLDFRFKIFSAGYFIITTVIVYIKLVAYVQIFKGPDGWMDVFLSYIAYTFSLNNRIITYIVGISCLFLLVHSTSMLVYNSYMLTLYSTAMALRFEQITEKIQSRGSGESSKKFWIQVRADYIRLSKLCTKLNAYVSINVIASFASNMFFMIGHFFTILSGWQKVPLVYYLTESASYIFICMIVCVYTSWINEASTKPAAILNTVASCNYDREVHHLLMQIAFNNVALNGGNLFRCNKRLILNMAGAVIAYLLALVQLSI